MTTPTVLLSTDHFVVYLYISKYVHFANFSISQITWKERVLSIAMAELAIHSKIALLTYRKLLP